LSVAIMPILDRYAISWRWLPGLAGRRMGGLSNVVGWLALLAIPGALLFLLPIDETHGLSLEDAAREDAFEDRL
jgi:hypothetical protein